MTTGDVEVLAESFHLESLADPMLPFYPTEHTAVKVQKEREVQQWRGTLCLYHMTHALRGKPSHSPRTQRRRPAFCVSVSRNMLPQEETRLRHRVLDLRRPRMQDVLRMRGRVARLVRERLEDEHGELSVGWTKLPVAQPPLPNCLNCPCSSLQTRLS